MKRLLLLSLVAMGCAHAPAVEGSGGPSISIIREAVKQELLAAAYRPGPTDYQYALNGQPEFLGTIDFTGTSKTNAQASVAFNDTGDTLCGKLLLVQVATGGSAYLGKAVTSTSTVTATNGVELALKERALWMMPMGVNCFLAALRVSVDGTLKVWWLK